MPTSSPAKPEVCSACSRAVCSVKGIIELRKGSNDCAHKFCKYCFDKRAEYLFDCKGCCAKPGPFEAVVQQVYPCSSPPKPLVAAGLPSHSPAPAVCQTEGCLARGFASAQAYCRCPKRA